MTISIEHFEVYREPGRFAGWPANYGIWAWGDEVVMGFTLGYMKVEEGLFHLRDTNRPFVTMQSRSLDGGRTWETQPFPGSTAQNRGLSADEHMDQQLWLAQAMKQADCTVLPQPSPGEIDFTAPDFAFMAARSGPVQKAGAKSFFYTSHNRCQTWDGPYALPMFGQTGISARTDYQVMAPHDALFFISANKADGSEGKIICTRTRDGGRSFEFVSDIGPKIEGQGWDIMPASIRLPNGRLLVARRCGRPAENDAPWRHWIDLYFSDDEGQSWEYLSTPAQSTGLNGNPPTLNRLHDGRLVIVYGFRDQPYGIRAVLSDDEGQSWSDPIHLRDDGGAPDLGYPRSTVLEDGTLLTVYYFEDKFDGERYIAATRVSFL